MKYSTGPLSPFIATTESSIRLGVSLPALAPTGRAGQSTPLLFDPSHPTIDFQSLSFYQLTNPFFSNPFVFSSIRVAPSFFQKPALRRHKSVELRRVPTIWPEHSTAHGVSDLCAQSQVLRKTAPRKSPAPTLRSWSTPRSKLGWEKISCPARSPYPPTARPNLAAPRQFWRSRTAWPEARRWFRSTSYRVACEHNRGRPAARCPWASASRPRNCPIPIPCAPARSASRLAPVPLTEDPDSRRRQIRAWLVSGPLSRPSGRAVARPIQSLRALVHLVESNPSSAASASRLLRRPQDSPWLALAAVQRTSAFAKPR